MEKKPKRKSKDELLDIIYSHLQTQIEFADKLKVRALQYIDSEEKDDGKKKRVSSFLNAYNTQVDALSRTTSTMIRLQNSSYTNGEETEEESNDSLVD